MFRFSLLIVFFSLCFSCNKKDEKKIEAGNTVVATWTWKTPQMKPFILSGKVSTFAGFPGDQGEVNGFAHYASFMSPSGITTDGTYLYIADYLDSTIRRVSIETQEETYFAGPSGVSGDDNGIGSAASFNSLWMIATDGTNVYVADGENNTIRKIE